MAMGTHLAKLISFIIANVSDTSINTIPHSSARTVTCISCMSPMFNAKLSTPDGSEISLWESLSSQYFKLPENFSRYCDPEYFDPGKLRLRTCLDTCVWLSMDNAFFGKAHRTYMRGCLADLKDHNFNITRFMKYQTKCSKISYLKLFNSAVHTQLPADQIVSICACHSNKCNGASFANVSSYGGWKLIVLSLLIALFFVSLLFS